MTQETELPETSLKIERAISAPVEKVYAAWTDPEQMAQWMGPGEVGCKNVDIDLKVGGEYSIHMVSEDGDHIAIGAYKEIVPNQRLQFTWSWKDGEMPETLVTVDFKDIDGSTQLTMLHESFPAKEAAEKHNAGWNGCLDKLLKLVS